MNDDLRDKFRGLGNETWELCDRVVPLVFLTRLRGTGNNICDLLRAMPVKLSVEDGNIFTAYYNLFHFLDAPILWHSFKSLNQFKVLQH